MSLALTLLSLLFLLALLPLMSLVMAVINFLHMSLRILHKMFRNNCTISFGDMYCFMRISILIEPSMTTVHALITCFRPTVSLMGQPFLILPSMDLMIVSICIFSIKSSLCVSLEVFPDLGVSISLRACFIFRGVDMSSVCGDDWCLMSLRCCDIDSWVIGRLVISGNAGGNGKGGWGYLVAADQSSDESEAECFFDVHSIINLFQNQEICIGISIHSKITFSKAIFLTGNNPNFLILISSSC